MIEFWAFVLCAIFMTIAQIAYPGLSLYHTGWYNALNAFLMILALFRYRALRKKSVPVPAGALIALTGAAIVVLTGVAAGLMGPDTHVVAGVPASTVPDEAASIDLQFPPPGSPVSAFRYTGGYIIRPVARDVVVVDANDATGNHLTMTQPANASFLSPVLLMQQRAKIAGMDVAIDGFALPAVRRTVKVVLFTPEQASRLPVAVPPGSGAILFSLSDQSGRSLPRGIGVVAPGKDFVSNGLRLHASIENYPAFQIESAPYLPVFLAGLLIFLGGSFRSLYRSKT